MPASTVHAVLVRCRLNRLHHVDKRTGEVIRRYEHDKPGAMIHVDVKKLGNIPDGGGWRYVGRRQGKQNRAATPSKPQSSHRNPLIGTAYVHTVIDDHSRVAYAEIHSDETRSHRRRSAQTGSVLVCRPRRHRREGPLRQRIGLQVPPLAGHLPGAEHQGKEDPAVPPADQRKDRTLPPHSRRRVGFQTLLRHGISPQKRAPRMAAPLQSTQTPHRNRRPPAHQPFN